MSPNTISVLRCNEGRGRVSYSPMRRSIFAGSSTSGSIRLDTIERTDEAMGFIDGEIYGGQARFARRLAAQTVPRLDTIVHSTTGNNARRPHHPVSIENQAADSVESGARARRSADEARGREFEPCDFISITRRSRVRTVAGTCGHVGARGRGRGGERGTRLSLIL